MRLKYNERAKYNICESSFEIPLVNYTHKPLNRRQRREAKKEKEKIENYLIRVEFWFYEALFCSEFNTYDVFYEWYNDIFRSMCKNLRMHYPLKWCEPNDLYFVDSFRAKEPKKIINPLKWFRS